MGRGLREAGEAVSWYRQQARHVATRVLAPLTRLAGRGVGESDSTRAIGGREADRPGSPNGSGDDADPRTGRLEARCRHTGYDGSTFSPAGTRLAPAGPWPGGGGTRA